LLLALLRRVSTLAQRHGPAPIELDYRALKERAEAAEFAATELRWVEWARWSGRQQALLKMGGLLGVLALPLAGLEPFWPFLALAPWVHVGKGATMGLGAIQVTAA
jgi:CRISPR/Cas system endoribonuclease Cas6 (RAMP superfamily)